MNEIILLKLGELVLKGLNRRTFEDRLVANARRRLQAHGKFKVYTKQSTMYVEPQSEDCDLDGAWEAMTKLFGVVGLSRARACAKDKDAMLQTAVEYLGDRLAAAKTFKVESKRADKNFPMTSIQLSQYVGGELDEKYPNLTVDVHHPELTVYLEVRDYILLKLGELVLKGLNRRTFEDRLVANARRRLQAHGKFKVYTKQSTMYVEPQSEDCDLDGAWEAMTKLFGVVGLSRARACAKDKDAMLQTAVEYLGDRLAAAKTFKVESKRADKNFPMTSIQLSQYVGGELDEKYPNLTVDVHHPELTVYLEVRDYAAYVHADPEPGAGGLPVGVGGRAVSLLSGGIDSPVASWMIAKRGIALEMVHFFSYPYTSEEAKQKVLTLAKLLTPWCGRLTVHVVPFTAIQEELRRKCPEELFTVLMRRFMMRIAEAVAQRCGAGAIVTGECLGQVASQTMEAMRATTAVTTLPILRPVVGMDKEEIVRIARRINTFETSILPYEDCCTVFTPRHPRLRPVLGELEAAEAALDVEGLVKAAVDGIERVQV